MKEIIKLGLVMGVLFCAAIGAASAQEEYSEDYKEGFYNGAVLLVRAVMDADYLANVYYSLGGEPTDETIVFDNQTLTVSDFYNQEATRFNQETIPLVNDIIVDIFGAEDNRSEQLMLTELPLIS